MMLNCTIHHLALINQPVEFGGWLGQSVSEIWAPVVGGHGWPQNSSPMCYCVFSPAKFCV